MPRRWILVLFATALAVRLPALMGPHAFLPVVAPWGPLLVWVQPWLDGLPGGWGWRGLGILAAFVDAGAAVLLALLVERRRLAERLLAPRLKPEGWGSQGFWAGLAWAANPTACLLAGSAGAWQSVALLSLLVAVWNLEYSAHPAADSRAAFAMGLAISVALWPLLLLPLGAAGLLSQRARLRFYLQAMLLPLALALPWLILSDPQSIVSILRGPSSVQGLPGLICALWSAAGAPYAQLHLLLQAWEWGALGGLLVYFFSSFWRPVSLLPGLALGAWVWILLAPQLQPPLFVAPLGLALLVPGRLPFRLSVATFVLVLLQDLIPGVKELLLQPTDGSGLWRGTHLLWAALDLFWLFWVSVEILRLWAYSKRPLRQDFFR